MMRLRAADNILRPQTVRTGWVSNPSSLHFRRAGRRYLAGRSPGRMGSEKRAPRSGTACNLPTSRYPPASFHSHSPGYIGRHFSSAHQSRNTNNCGITHNMVIPRHPNPPQLTGHSQNGQRRSAPQCICGSSNVPQVTQASTRTGNPPDL